MKSLSVASSRSLATGFSYAMAAAVLWSFIGPFSKGALAAGVSPMETAFWRALFGGLFFAGQTAASRGLRIPFRDAALFFLFGSCGVGLLYGSLQVSIQQSGAAMAMVLLYTAPVWVAVASRWLFGEALSPRKLAAICVSLVGAALVCLSGGSLPADASTLGVVCGLLSGLAYAAHFPFYAWWGSRYPTSTIYTYMLLGGVSFLLPFVSFAPGKSATAWGHLLALGVLTNYAAYVAFAASLRLISQVQAAVIGNIEPVLATLWVWMLFDENFTAYGWLGCALVVASVFFMTTEQKS